MSEPTERNHELAVKSDRSLRLIFAGRVDQRVNRELDHGRAIGAFTKLRTHGTSTAIEFLCDDIEFTDQRPTGDSLKPTEDWLYISLHRPGQPLAESIDEFRVQPWQTMIWLILDQSHPGKWSATVVRLGQTALLPEIHVVGSGMVRLLSTPPSLTTDEDILERWSRTRGVTGDLVFNRLQDSIVTLIGAGRMGTLIAFLLASLGVGIIRLIDSDQLFLHNFDANPGVPLSTCGQSKGMGLAAGLQLFRPDMTVKVIEHQAAYRTVEDYLQERSDLVVTCVDSDVARLAVALAARRNLFVHLDAATSIQRSPGGELSMTGDVTLLLPTEGCSSCVGGFENPAATRHDLTAPANSLRRQMPQEWNEQRAGSLVTLNSMIAGAAVQSWLDLLTGAQPSSVWHRFAWVPGQGMQCDSSPMVAAEDCDICHMFKKRNQG